MKIYKNKNKGKVFLFLFAILIGVSSFIYTEFLVSRLKTEERKKVEVWAEATKLIISADENQNLEFLSSIMENNRTVPVILTDGHDNILASSNFDASRINDPGFIEKMKQENEPIVIDLGSGFVNRIYYKDSFILTQLTYYPYVQLGFIVLFILVSFIALNTSRKAQQNKVWVGMSKETAHQLGTPTSSLAGWVEILQTRYPDIPINKELAMDVARLEKVTERFSRIGSKPELANEDIIKLILHSVDYLKSRSSSKVIFILNFEPDKEVKIPVNAALFEWVIENVSKNAIDAMEGNGEITFKVAETEKNVIIDVTDTGKGIPKRAFKKIFTAGFTTKERGWGLGLSLTKRIIEDYHHGKIFVRYSEIGKGSCIRIMMNRNHS